MSKLSRNEQDSLVSEMLSDWEVIDSDEWDEMYEKLDDRHRSEIDDFMDDVMETACGDPSWKSGRDWEDDY